MPWSRAAERFRAALPSPVGKAIAAMRAGLGGAKAMRAVTGVRRDGKDTVTR